LGKSILDCGDQWQSMTVSLARAPLDLHAVCEAKQQTCTPCVKQTTRSTRPLTRVCNRCNPSPRPRGRQANHMVRTEFEMKLQSRTRGTCNTSIALVRSKRKRESVSSCSHMQSYNFQCLWHRGALMAIKSSHSCQAWSKTAFSPQRMACHCAISDVTASVTAWRFWTIILAQIRTHILQAVTAVAQ